MYNGEMVSETQQSYSDSHSGMQKAGLERARGDRARKIVKERVNGRETSRDMLKNIREDETGQFDADWNTAAQHSGISNTRMRSMLGNSQRQQQHRLQNASYKPQGSGGRAHSSSLPYGGNVQDAMRAGDRGAIRQLMAAQERGQRGVRHGGSVSSGSGHGSFSGRGSVRSGRSNSRSSVGSSRCADLASELADEEIDISDNIHNRRGRGSSRSQYY